MTDTVNRADVLAALEDELHSEYSSLAAGAIKRCIARTRDLPSATHRMAEDRDPFGAPQGKEEL